MEQFEQELPVIDTYGLDIPLKTQQEYDDMKRALDTVDKLKEMEESNGVR